MAAGSEKPMDPNAKIFVTGWRCWAVAPARRCARASAVRMQNSAIG